MKRLGVLIALAAAFALLPVHAASADILDLSAGVFPDDELAALSSSGDPFAVGGGTLATGTHFAFSAHLGPNSPSGYALVSDPTFGEAQGHVCAYYPQPDPREAEFSIVVEKGSGTFGSFSSLVFHASDFGGEPPSGAPDELFVGVSSCGSVDPPLTGGPVVQGNIVVRP
jgi:hypothetical protein